MSLESFAPGCARPPAPATIWATMVSWSFTATQAGPALAFELGR
jgi:hypothetical protein